MVTRTWLQEQLEWYRADPDYLAELLLLDLNEQVVGRMTELELRRVDLAERMGVSRAYVTKLLRGSLSPTLRTIAALAIALDARPAIQLHSERRGIAFEEFPIPGVGAGGIVSRAAKEADFASISAIAA